MKKLNIYDVIDQLKESTTPDKIATIQLTLESDQDLLDLWHYLDYKRAIVNGKYTEIDDRLKNFELFYFNYNLILTLLNEKLFLNAYRDNVKEMVYRFTQAVKDFKYDEESFEKNFTKKDLNESVIPLLNGLINQVNNSSGDVSELEAMKKLYAVESTTYRDAFIAFTTNDTKQLKLRYEIMTNMECMVFTMYYLMDKEDIFYDKNVLKSAKPYLEKLETLYQNYKNYGVIDKLERIREIKK